MTLATSAGSSATAGNVSSTRRPTICLQQRNKDVVHHTCAGEIVTGRRRPSRTTHPVPRTLDILITTNLTISLTDQQACPNFGRQNYVWWLPPDICDSSAINLNPLTWKIWWAPNNASR
jgi:hypothetical protein